MMLYVTDRKANPNTDITGLDLYINVYTHMYACVYINSF